MIRLTFVSVLRKTRQEVVIGLRYRDCRWGTLTRKDIDHGKKDHFRIGSVSAVGRRLGSGRRRDRQLGWQQHYPPESAKRSAGLDLHHLRRCPSRDEWRVCQRWGAVPRQ